MVYGSLGITNITCRAPVTDPLAVAASISLETSLSCVTALVGDEFWFLSSSCLLKAGVVMLATNEEEHPLCQEWKVIKTW